MTYSLLFRLPPEEAQDDLFITDKIARDLRCKPSDIKGFRILKRSIDARGKRVLINLNIQAFVGETPSQTAATNFPFRDVKRSAKTVVIIGAGPAGLFAALKFLELGIKPVILERGKDVRARRRDLAAMNKLGEVNPESNYCFGEGGAGTYSDGKLYTRSSKRGDVNRILQLFVHFGASHNILIDAHPHIGTNKLPQIITAMRELIIQCGGEVHFDQKVTGLQISGQSIRSVCTADGQQFSGDAVVLATGHSARDVFHLLHNHQVRVEAKPFALGVRVEHPQQLIDSIQYHCPDRGPYLPPASYSLVQQVNELGVFSFCMCPGGIIAPAATAPGEIVVNGWSPSKRNNPFANSGIVVSVNHADAQKSLKSSISDADDPFLFLRFQEMVERNAFLAGGNKLTAPAQRMVDFCEGRVSTTLPSNSYLPGLASAGLDEVLPQFVYEALSGGFRAFGKKMKGYYTNEAVVVATESRTSSPVRIPRDPITGCHPQVNNLYPCGEGAGYAGGIVSAAMDGENIASLAGQKLLRL